MICPNCKQKLIKIDNSYKCSNKHSFDISKQGYVNLLLNSKNSGDNKEMINARYEFLKKGYFDNLLTSISSIIKSLNITNILDIGCGEGYYDRGIKEQTNVNITGLDISIIVLASTSVLKGCKSSIEPPPLAIIITSISFCLSKYFNPLIIVCSAPIP